MGNSIKTKVIRTSGLVAFLALIGAAPLPVAAAEPATGFYIGAGAGGNFMQDEPITGVHGFSPNNLNLTTDVGGVGVLSGGYAWGNGIRTEFELNYRYNGLHSITGPKGNSATFHNSNSGSEQKYGPMPSIYYDFNGISPDIVPYVGVGVGYQEVMEKLSIDGYTKSKSEGAIATQVVIGAAFPISSVPGLSITADYRFLYVAGNRTYTANVNGHTGPGVTLGDDFNHAVLLGVHYVFGQTPPVTPARVAPAPVAATPAPQPARTYLVFFDWDKTDLTEHARQIVYDAAMGASKVRSTRITVNGFTDTSGSGQYNQALSVRRAKTVADELVRDGVPASVISIQGFGESNPLVPTANGVREPQNRRVEIVIR